MTNQDIILASIAPPSLFNFYPDRLAAEADIARANRDTLARGPYSVMTYGEYKAAEREFYLADPAQEITAEKFTEMLGILPPLKWTSTGTFESFLMSEFWSVPYTHQYIRRGNRYFTKLVDATDRSTWMKEVA